MKKRIKYTVNMQGMLQGIGREYVFPNDEMEENISEIKQAIKGASIRQISRVSGISVNIVRYIK